mgnify:CR=1 FL=1
MGVIKQKDILPASDTPWSQGARVYNGSGVTIAPYDVVYVSGRRGLHLSVTAADADSVVSSLGNLMISRHSIPAGEYGHALPWMVESSVNTSAALGAGSAVYLSGTAGGWTVAVPTTGAKIRIGTVLEDNAVTGAVLLAPGLTDASSGGASLEIADVANGQSFTVVNSGVISVTTTGAHGRTLPVPTFLGQEILITFDVTGGDLTLTVTGGMNASNHTSAVMQHAGDHVMFRAGQVGGALLWRLVSNDGALTS